MEKEKRIVLYENDKLIFEQRGDNKYYVCFYEKETGKFKREVAITLKDDYTVTMCNSN